MMTREPFSDAALEAMLARRANRGDPGDLPGRVGAALERTRPRRIRWEWGRLVPEAIRAGRLTPVLAALLLLALLVGTLLVGALWLRQQDETPISLVPTVVETVWPTYPTAGRVAEDGTGALWALGDGRVARIDPASGDQRSWTVSDDATFAASVSSPARAGGVWVWSGGSIRRFTGEVFADPIPASWHPVDLAEAPDGTLWAWSTDRGLERWDGTRWTPPAVAAPIDEPDALLAVGPDEVWIAGADMTDACSDPDVSCSVVAHLVDGRWSLHHLALSRPYSPTVVRAPDGSVWAGPAETGLFHFDGDREETVAGPEVGWNVTAPGPVRPLAVGPDGSLWAAHGGSLFRRDPGGSWTGYDDWFHSYDVTAVAATARGVFAVTETGLARVQGDELAPLWPDPADGPGFYANDPGVAGLLGISEDEAWALGLWHFVDGDWQGPTQPSGFQHRVTALALGADGAVWVASLDRVAVLRSDGWTTAWASQALLVDGDLDVGPDGSVWVGTIGGVARITAAADGFSVQQIDCPVPGATLAVARDGSVWVGGDGWIRAAGLARVVGGRCERVDTGQGYEVRSIEADPGGGVIVAYEEGDGGTTPSCWPDPSVTSSVARMDEGRFTLLGQTVAACGSSQAAVTPSGDVWWTYASLAGEAPGVVGGSGGLLRFDGGEWSEIVADGHAWGPLSVSPDGTVWFASPAGIHRIRADASG